MEAKAFVRESVRPKVGLTGARFGFEALGQEEEEETVGVPTEGFGVQGTTGGRALACFDVCVEFFVT